MSAPPTILVFDSGLGGLTVLREIVRARPDAHYIYVADDAFFPYGHHGEEQIIARVVPLVGELIAIHRPDLVVIACNTASTLVMSHLRAAYKVPFVGTVPAIKPACASSKTKRVSVLGTKGTVKREYTRRLIHDFAQGCEVTLVGSAELASLAESALSGNEVNDKDISAELAPCFVGNGETDSARTDTVVLACTHYPLLKDKIQRFLPAGVQLLSQGQIVANSLVDYLNRHPEIEEKCSKNGQLAFFTTDSTEDFDNHATTFFGKPVSSSHLDLEKAAQC